MEREVAAWGLVSSRPELAGATLDPVPSASFSSGVLLNKQPSMASVQNPKRLLTLHEAALTLRRPGPRARRRNVLPAETSRRVGDGR